MFYTCVLIKLSLISYVVGLNVDIMTKTETETKLANLEENINGTMKKLESLNRLVANIDGKWEATNQKTENLVEKITETVKTFEKKVIELLEKNRISQDMNCKERVVHAVGHGYNFNHQMNPIETLNHVTLRRNDFGVTDFKINLGIKAARDGIILLSSKMNPGHNDLVFEIVVGGYGNSKTFLRLTVNNVNMVFYADTANILNSTHFKDFHLNIAKGNLKFTKAGDSKPLLTYPHADLKSVKYISFTTWGTTRLRSVMTVLIQFIEYFKLN